MPRLKLKPEHKSEIINRALLESETFDNEFEPKSINSQWHTVGPTLDSTAATLGQFYTKWYS